GSTVSSVLRNAWGYRRMEHRVRGRTYSAPPAPVGLLGHITMGELLDARSGLRTVDVRNGLANRVLWTYVERGQRIPSPRAVDERVLRPLVIRLRASLENARRLGLVERSVQAEQLWGNLYTTIDQDEGWGLVDDLTARA